MHAPLKSRLLRLYEYRIQNTECIMLTQTQLGFGNDHQCTKRITAALKTAQPHGRGRPHDKVRLGDRDEFKATQGAISWTSTAKAPRPQALVAGRPPPRRQAQNKSVRNRLCDRTKIVRGRTALGCRGGEGVSRSQQASYGDPARAGKSVLSSTYS